MPHLVKMYGRSLVGISLIARPTTSSECPKPYTAAVSTQLIPNSTPCRTAAMESLSSCGPQPNDHPPPPIAHVPTPTVVISMPLLPSGRFFSITFCGAMTVSSVTKLVPQLLAVSAC